MGRYTNFCNLFDLCAIAVPAGMATDGAQFGVTLLAPAHHDGVLADLAARFLGCDEAPGWPETAGVLACADLAVFGLHLRGQPLEHQLAGRGARWAGPLRTAPRYRLFELDTEPAKPALIRDEHFGASIAGERWVLPTALLGAFLAALPAPMHLGAVELDDGTWITGFAADHDAAVAGRDITAAGGWLAARSVPAC